MWDVDYSSFKTSIELFFFPFLFSGYCHSVGPRVVRIVSVSCNQSFSARFYVVFESSTLSLKLVSPLPPSFLSTSSRGCNALCMVLSFLMYYYYYYYYSIFSSVFAFLQFFSGFYRGPRVREGILSVYVFCCFFWVIFFSHIIIIIIIIIIILFASFSIQWNVLLFTESQVTASPL